MAEPCRAAVSTRQGLRRHPGLSQWILRQGDPVEYDFQTANSIVDAVCHNIAGPGLIFSMIKRRVLTVHKIRRKHLGENHDS